MEFMIRVNITDPSTAEALLEAKKLRKMASYVESALSHYARTPEGIKAKEMLGTGKSKSAPKKVEKAAEKSVLPSTRLNEQVVTGKTPVLETSNRDLDMGGFLRIRPPD